MSQNKTAHQRFADKVVACTVRLSDSEIPCTDPNGGIATCTLLNPKRVPIEKITVDGCITGIARIRKCDFAFVRGHKRVWYLELKGGDYDHAITQLKSTLAMFQVHHAAKTKKECVLVGTRVPAAGPETQVIKKEFKELGAKFNPLTTPAELLIS